MAPSWRTAGLIAASVIALVAVRAEAADQEDPDWPCVQRKIETLTAAQMWDGPEIDNSVEWQHDQDVTRLIPVLVSRRVPMEQAAAEIAKFADSKPKESRDAALTALFAGLLSTMNADRALVLKGLDRFTRSQRERTAELERQAAEVRKLKDRVAAGENVRAQLKDAEDKYNWDARIFTERRQSLPLACEVPVLIEQRLFALAREIRTHMSDSN